MAARLSPHPGDLTITAMRRSVHPGIALMFASAVAWRVTAAQQPPSARQADAPRLSDDQTGAYRIALNVDLVVLPVTVLDKTGGYAANLRQADFRVYEDGVLQSIRLFSHEDVPVTVGLVIDHSGSMKNKMPDVVSGARVFARASNPADQMFVVNFSEKVSGGLPDSLPFTNRTDELEAAIGVLPAQGETALYDAIGVALDRLKSGDRARKVLIVISDGGDNASSLTLPAILKKAVESNAAIYTVGIFEPEDADQNPGVLRQLARTTGGQAFFPAELRDVVTTCESIANDIRHQYTLGYVSANSSAVGGYRAVRVVAHAAGRSLVARTRAGYLAGDGR